MASDTPRLAYIKTWGCQMNEYDSLKISDILEDRLTIKTTSCLEEGTILIMNTCSVREKAQEKVYSMLGRWAKLKQKNPNIIIAVGGCVASDQNKKILNRAPYVDIVFGPQNIHMLPQLIEKVKWGRGAQIELEFLADDKFASLPNHVVKNDSKNLQNGFVSIMEGCSKYCSYCIVPYTRGSEYYRSVTSIVNEILSLLTQGVETITLLGQNVNAWQGVYKNNNVDFSWLLQLISTIDEVKKIKYVTSHPLEMTPRLIKAHQSNTKLVNELHLPVQSGSNRILSMMKRGYTREEYFSIVRKIRVANPDIRLTTDFIVGFPTESDQDFEDSFELANQVGFDKAYCFLYSKRPNTPAENMTDNTPVEIYSNRLQQLQNLFKNNPSQHMPKQITFVSP